MHPSPMPQNTDNLISPRRMNSDALMCCSAVPDGTGSMAELIWRLHARQIPARLMFVVRASARPIYVYSQHRDRIGHRRAYRRLFPFSSSSARHRMHPWPSEMRWFGLARHLQKNPHPTASLRILRFLCTPNRHCTLDNGRLAVRTDTKVV